MRDVDETVGVPIDDTLAEAPAVKEKDSVGVAVSEVAADSEACADALRDAETQPELVFDASGVGVAEGLPEVVVDTCGVPDTLADFADEMLSELVAEMDGDDDNEALADGLALPDVEGVPVSQTEAEKAPVAVTVRLAHALVVAEGSTVVEGAIGDAV